MESKGSDIARFIKMRQHFHMRAEGAFKEFETQKKLRETLLSFDGVKASHIKDCAITGLVVDIYGTGKPDKSSKVNLVAIRADMDALPMPENNPHLAYKTQTDHAHMCGHDGHMTMLLAAAQIFAKHRGKVPSNKGIRLLF
jgi:metal-dependent amidase/aminoacylase/carboxypeptidase family protein